MKSRDTAAFNVVVAEDGDKSGAGERFDKKIRQKKFATIVEKSRRTKRQAQEGSTQFVR